MGPPPVVTGISPKEALPGTKLTVRGENLGVSPQDILGLLIHGSDCLLTADWKSSNKLTVLCPAPSSSGSDASSSGDIVVATRSGGIGSCTVQLKILKQASVGALQEVAVWTPEKYFPLRKTRAFSPNMGGMEGDDALGLSVEGSGGSKMSEEQMQQMFPGKTADISAENFDPVCYLLENHSGTTFEDLQLGLASLRRKVDGESESQLSFIKSNVNSIMDQLEALKSIRTRVDIDNRQYGKDPTDRVQKAISKAKNEADQMFKDVLGRKDRADSTRNAINVLNRFKFLFNLPSNIESNLVKNDFDRIIDEYERAKSLYGNTDSEIFQLYLDEIEKGVDTLKARLEERLQDPSLGVEQQKKVIANLVQLNVDGDPAWSCLQVQYAHVLKNLDQCRDSHLEKNRAKPHQRFPSSPSTKNLLFPAATEADQSDTLPECVLFVHDVTEKLAEDFGTLWKFGQAYFKGDLVVDADSGKQPVYKEMILGAIRYFANLIRAAIIPQTLKATDELAEYGLWGDDTDKIAAQWLPSCLRHVRKSYAAFISLDLPNQALDIIKQLTTDLRIQCLQMIFQTVIDQAHLLHEKEDWKTKTNDEVGSITQLPETFENLVSQSVQLIKEALLTTDNREEDILSYQNAHDDLELLIQNVLSSFAVTLENAAVENYSLSDVPSDAMRLLLCLNNCQYTRTHVLPKIQKSFQDVGQLSLEKPIIEAVKCYVILHGKLLEAYLELKNDHMVSIIEPSMYVGKFDWARCPKPTDARDYVKEILQNVVAVHSEVDSISAVNNSQHNYIHEILSRVVESLAEEVNRLFCCISRMNSNGCIQAWVDIHCLQTFLAPFMTKAAKEFLSDAAKPLYDLERPGDKEVVESCVKVFEKRMRLHLLVFKSEVERV